MTSRAYFFFRRISSVTIKKEELRIWCELVRHGIERHCGNAMDVSCGVPCLLGQEEGRNCPDWRWMPYHVFRFYKSPEFPSRLISVSAILDVEAKEKHRLDEPIISGIVFDYGAGQELGTMTTDQYDYAGWHIYMPGYLPDRKNDGTVLICADPKTDWPSDRCTAERAASFGVPLIEIGDSANLRSRVMEPRDRLARSAILGA